MGDVNTASTLITVAAVLQVIFSIVNLFVGTFFVLVFLPFIFEPWMMGAMAPVVFFTFGFNIIMGIIGFILCFLWLTWRHYPSEHKTGLIVSGILGLFFGGFLPGLLVLIGGFITPSPVEFTGFEPVKTVPYRTERRCSSCGAEATDDDKFCWRCGAAL